VIIIFIFLFNLFKIDCRFVTQGEGENFHFCMIYSHKYAPGFFKTHSQKLKPIYSFLNSTGLITRMLKRKSSSLDVISNLLFGKGNTFASISYLGLSLFIYFT
jgi:hypothetical protein